MKLVFATRNSGKLVEMRALLPEFEVVGVTELDFPVSEVVEDGDSFAANATKKAREVAAATGLPAIADDSGLEVAALGGRPGVHSARYAGPGATDADNNAKLIGELRGIADRSARFRSVVAFVDPSGGELFASGSCDGAILEAPRGSGGFGYDPLFFSPELGCTFAEAGVGKKSGLSHRARAVAALLPDLCAHFHLAIRAPQR